MSLWIEVVAHFQELEDPRSTINRRHPLASVVVIALLAVPASGVGVAGLLCAYCSVIQEYRSVPEPGESLWE